MKNRYKYILWSVLIVAIMLVSALMPLTDTSEARYATIAKTMVETGNIWSPEVWIDGKLIPFMGKPPLGFWMMAASMRFFGINEFSARFPSILSSLLLLGIIYFVMKRYSSQYTASVSTLIILTTASFFILANAALVDPALMLFSIGAIFLYYAYLCEKKLRIRKTWSRFVFIFLGLAFITKGPVGLAYFGIPVFFWTLLSGQWATLKQHAWFSGGVLFLAITVPCFYYVEKAMPGFLKYFFVNENFLRYTKSDYGDLYSSASHKLFFGAAIPMTLGACAPWILFPLYKFVLYLNSLREKKANNRKKKKFNLKQIHIYLKKNLKNKESLFSTGFIALILFWSCSNQIMFYYLILLVPLFGVWCAGYMRNLQIPDSPILKASVVVLFLYILLYIPAIFILEQTSSSREAVKKAVALCNQKRDNEKRILFVRRVPYSGYFYGGNIIMAHGKETVEQSIERGMKNKSTIFIMRTKYFKRISKNLLLKIKIRDRNKKWIIATFS